MAEGTINHVNDSGWLTVNNDTFTGGLQYRKYNNIVQIRSNGLFLTSELQPYSQLVLCNIPSGYRPTKILIGTAGSWSDNNKDTNFRTIIDANGNIYLYAISIAIKTNYNLFISFMYFTD